MRPQTIFLASILAATVSVAAEDTNRTVRSVSLTDCIQTALENNLGLKISRISPEIARYQVSLAKTAYDPEFFASGQHDHNVSAGGIDAQNRPYPGSVTDGNSFSVGFNGILPSGMSYTLSGALSEQYGSLTGSPFDRSSARLAVLEVRQPILKNFWIDGTRFNIQSAKNRLKYSEEGWRLVLMNTVQEVQIAYYGLIQARENIRNQEKALALAQRLLDENKKRVEVGALAPLDEKQAESQVAQARASLIQAQNSFSVQENALKALLTDNFSKMYDVLFEPSESLAAVAQPLDVHESWQKALAQRPDLLQSKLDLDRSGLLLKYQRNQLYPQLNLIGRYGWTGSGVEFSDALGSIQRGNNPYYSYGAEIRIPVGNRAARQNYRITKSEQEQLILREQELEQGVMIQVDNAIKTAQAAFEAVDATHAARLYAEAALDAEQKKLENGKSTSFVVLQLQRDLTFARTSEINALATYNIALARLAYAEGTTLERNNVVVAAK